MEIRITEIKADDMAKAAAIWNQVVEDGVAFPQTELLDKESASPFFTSQSFTAVAREQSSGQIVGLYILHPNNVGRCGHICNASFAVKKELRGLHIGEALIRHCLVTAKELGFRILQFNAVVKSNPALFLYKKLGFIELGTIPGGFLSQNGRYEDIVLMYHLL